MSWSNQAANLIQNLLIFLLLLISGIVKAKVIPFTNMDMNRVHNMCAIRHSNKCISNKQ